MSTWQDFAVADLARSGLAITDIDAEEAMGPFGSYDGYKIPYYTRLGERHPMMWRIRMASGDARYVQPKAEDLGGDSAPPYFHRHCVYTKLGQIKLIIEGEKKALCGQKFLSNVQTIGIGGCWNWQAPLTAAEQQSKDDHPNIPIIARLHPEIVQFSRGGAGPMYYVPDGDFRTNIQVMRALGSMLLACKRAGLWLRIIILPKGVKGLDDWLMAQPPGTHDAAFWALEQTNGAGFLTRESDMQAHIGLKLDKGGRPVQLEDMVIEALAKWDYLIENYYYDTRAVRHMLRDEDGVFRMMGDIHIETLKRYMQRALGFGPISRAFMESVMYGLAAKFPRNPLSDYLHGLEWDGTPRFDALAGKLGVPTHLRGYSASALMNLMVAACARAHKPGTKFDHCVILEGHQGFGKSTFWEHLATLDGVCYYAVASITANSHVIGTRDFLTAGSKAIFYDLDELGVLSKSDVNAVKTMLSTTMDTYRPAYGRSDVEVQRAFLCVGSTNADAYLIDNTGNRRFWPIMVGDSGALKHFDMPWLLEVREQLWAEAMAAYRADHKFWVMSEEHEKQAMDEQEGRLIEGGYDIPVRDLLNSVFAANPVHRPPTVVHGGGEYYYITNVKIGDTLNVPLDRRQGMARIVGPIVKKQSDGLWVKMNVRLPGGKTRVYLLDRKWADDQPRIDVDTPKY